MKKKLSLSLAMAMVVSNFAPLAQSNLAYADSEKEFVEIQENEKSELEQNENELKDLEETVKGTEYEESVEEGLKTVEKLDSSLNITTFAAVPVYNLDSIGVRIEALTDATDAIVFFN